MPLSASPRIRARRTRAAATALTLALTACATWAPGEDPKGLELKASATPVLVALAKYHKDRGEYPASLHELVPKYLTAVPFFPNLILNPSLNRIEYVYSPSWPQTDDVGCYAQFGQLEWTCGKV